MNRNASSNKKRRATAPPPEEAPQEKPNPVTSPTSTAIAKMEEAVLTLPQPLQKSLREVFRKVINQLPTLTRLKQSRQLLARDDRPPKSTNFKFELTANRAVKETADFQALSTSVKSAMDSFQKELKSLIIQAKELEIKSCQQSIFDEIINAVDLFTRSQTIWQFGANESIKPINMAHIYKGVLDSDEVRSATAKSELLITERILQLIPADGQNQTDSNPQLVETMVAFLKKAIIEPIRAYESTRIEKEKQQSIDCLFNTKAASKATNDVAMALDSVEGLDHGTLKQLIQANVSQATKALNQKVASLSKKLRDSEKQNQKNSSQGGKQEPARGKQPENQDKAAAPVNATSNAKTTSDAKNPRNRSQKNKKKTAAKEK